MTMRTFAFILPLLLAASLGAQTVEVINPDPPPEVTVTDITTVPTDPKHGIEGVDPAPEDGSMATPLPKQQQRRLKRYDIQELTGARQAIGPQLIDGRLPKPLLDYISTSAAVTQRISFFEGDLVIVRLTGAGGTMMKRLLLPPDATKAYLKAADTKKLADIRQDSLNSARDGRTATLRIYGSGNVVERTFDPSSTLPKPLYDQVLPLQDLLRAITEDRTVTSTVANYEPKTGDELVGDDRRVYRVARIVAGSDIVELRCTSQPTVMFVSKNDLYQYFVGRKATQGNKP